jgi:hypothetical protein
MLRTRLAVTAALTPLIAATVVVGVASADPCVSGSLVLDSLTVGAGTTYCFDPTADTTVEIRNGGNAIVSGVLQMRPANATVDHVLKFTGINESGYVGGGDLPVATDPGLWVTGAGILDIAGTPKVAWNRTGDDPPGPRRMNS